MVELLRLTANSGDGGLVLVGTEGPRLENEKPIRGDARHAGRTAKGEQVYVVDHDEAEEKTRWLVVIVGTVECIEGAAIIATEKCESSNKANLVALGSEALVRVEGYAKRKGYRLYVNGMQKYCGESDAVLTALGIRNEADELRETPPVPPPSSKFRDSLARAGYTEQDAG